MSKIYLSGPMTGLPDLNFPAFNAAAARLRSLGFDVVNPAELNPDGASWGDCMRKDIVALMSCDTVATLPGWENSKGAQLEVLIGERLEMAVVKAHDLVRAPAILPAGQVPALATPAQDQHPSESQLEAAELGYPISKEDAVTLWYQGFRSPVITQAEVWEAMGSRDLGIHDKSELLEALRHMNTLCASYGYDAPHGLPRNEPVGWGTYALKGSNARQLFLVPGPDCQEARRIDIYASPFPLFRHSPAKSEQEPVAVLYKDGDVLTKAECGDVFDICCKVETPLYAAPVRSVMLPETKSRQEVINNTHYSQGWNDCIYATAKLNGIEP